jgi:uncharacterized protein YkwD
MRAVFIVIILIHLLTPCFSFLPLSLVKGSVQAAGDDGRDQSVEKRVIELVNRMRVKGAKCGSRYYRGTRPVVWNDTLGKVSLKHSLDMAGKENLGHAGTDGSGPGERIARFGYKWMIYGENVGEGYLTPEEVVNGWLRSQGHCENIMNPAFKEAGAAFAKGTRRIYWTLVLATPELASHLGP